MYAIYSQNVVGTNVLGQQGQEEKHIDAHIIGFGSFVARIHSWQIVARGLFLFAATSTYENLPG